ncbi:hypothetical protein LWI28_004114 [Acer negundo]|uniref:S-protein homolog n=1 Tax=Acer negundo TaxID=4023 RepID=A0AAD5J2W1_ACENE|nr:hypothetical protein LWI28_004114 [Acer negundo]
MSQYGLILYVHCKSRDNDLGLQNLTAGAEFEWHFKLNFSGSTLFWCYWRPEKGNIISMPISSTKRQSTPIPATANLVSRSGSTWRPQQQQHSGWRPPVPGIANWRQSTSQSHRSPSTSSGPSHRGHSQGPRPYLGLFLYKSLNTTLDRPTPDIINSWVPSVIPVSLPPTGRSTSPLPSAGPSQGLSPCGASSPPSSLPPVIASPDQLPTATAAALSSASAPTSAVPSGSAAPTAAVSSEIAVPTLPSSSLDAQSTTAASTGLGQLQQPVLVASTYTHVPHVLGWNSCDI